MSGDRRRAIRDLPFRHNAKPGLGFEILPLANLYARAARGLLDHALDAPQRPEFHAAYVGTRGRGTLVVDFTPTPLGAGYVTFVARGRVSQFTRVRRADAWILLFSPEFLATGAREVDPLRAPRVLSPAWEVPALAVGRDPELRDLVRLLEVEHARAQDALQAPLLAALLRAFLLRAERLANATAARDQPPPAELARFYAALEDDHLRTREVAHYARRAGLSPRALGELLVRATGRTTKRTIDDRVALELKRLLVHTDLTVKELAARAGFAEPTNLVKFFRNATGTTPQAFRASSRMILPSGRRS